MIQVLAATPFKLNSNQFFLYLLSAVVKDFNSYFSPKISLIFY